MPDAPGAKRGTRHDNTAPQPPGLLTPRLPVVPPGKVQDLIDQLARRSPASAFSPDNKPAVHTFVRCGVRTTMAVFPRPWRRSHDHGGVRTLGVDSKTRLIYVTVTTAANLHDAKRLGQRLPGDDTSVYDDEAYRGNCRQAAAPSESPTTQPSASSRPAAATAGIISGFRTIPARRQTPARMRRRGAAPPFHPAMISCTGTATAHTDPS